MDGLLRDLLGEDTITVELLRSEGSPFISKVPAPRTSVSEIDPTMEGLEDTHLSPESVLHRRLGSVGVERIAVGEGHVR